MLRHIVRIDQRARRRTVEGKHANNLTGCCNDRQMAEVALFISSAASQTLVYDGTIVGMSFFECDAGRRGGGLAQRNVSVFYSG